MNREEFFKKNDEKLLLLGFIKIEATEDPCFAYEKSILSDEAKAEFDEEYDEEYEPKLLVGDTGVNRGICLFLGTQFIWLAVENAEEAIEWSKKIVAIEEN